MKKPRSHLVTTVLASATMCWVLGLSSSGRGAVDWIVIGLVGAAILWNLWCLGARLARAGGGRYVAHLLRTLTLWIVGLMNTVWARPAGGRGWRWWIGAVLLALAVVDSAALYVRERRSLHGSDPGPGAAGSPEGGAATAPPPGEGTPWRPSR
jgi:hypothetical protein